MDLIEKLAAIEEIKALKARYWRGVDSKDEALLRSVFADDDLEIDMRNPTGPGSGGSIATDPDKFAANCLKALSGYTTAHHGHNPEIEILSATEATGNWPMEDRLWLEDASKSVGFEYLHGFGNYHDRYRKTEAGWKISYTTLKRSRVDKR
jgi:hypothetical protein